MILAAASAAQAEPLIYGFQAERLEYRDGDNGENVFVWDFDFVVGTDDLKLVWRSEAEIAEGSGDFEGLENQLRLQFPISTFFDGVVGVQASTPDGLPDRYNAVLGFKGLAPGFLEIDADFYLSDHSFFRFEGEYEGLITNRLILTPSIELTVPLEDDLAYDQASGGATMEAGLRLSYDLVDRSFSPYIGINYEKSFGGTADLIRASGKENGVTSIVFGTRLMF
ncbi:copper resistance protein B [Phaeobacter gallaeciensis]|uniref:copper resistance protein B n=2 Tax=Alphaproteobacteria TaxID=28211 RepID=UPI00237F11BE|nr:copper resistance protein B [Phaeobacter gallaeciensis]MDE4205921.1 copper resistance protein B [Phaeobacter gallaeciensis]MDE4368937.1 copper resistance protein B [Phaeobacter gallaeciensis]MDE4377864.1 copper resistance protein B [Phaeobacter gallaeciensis]MDE4408727.1 copper resistance protein B [Phaeobacter gallaeciensis]